MMSKINLRSIIRQAFLACALPFFTLVPPVVHALTEGDYTYTVNNNRATISFFTNYGYTGSLSIPRTLGGYPVTVIGHDAFGHHESITAVTIPDSVINIGAYAFGGCFALTNIAIPSSVTHIENNAFQYCTKLASIKIPASVVSMGGSTFSSCPSLTGIFFQGNAPTFGGGSYNTGDNAPVYYLPGTSNWQAYFLMFHPTVCWNPTIQGGSAFGFTGKRFRFNISGTPNIPLKVESSTNLTSNIWAPVTNAALDAAGTLSVIDPAAPHGPSRFYRVVFP